MATKKTAPAPAPAPLVQSEMFDAPSGDVRGFATAWRMTSKGEKRIAHTYLLTNEPVVISLELAKRVTPDELDDIIKTLTEYSALVRKLDKRA